MTRQRRLGWSYALQRAAEHASSLGKPLLIFEALRVDYPWASARLHRFALDAMAENQAAAADKGLAYYAYVEPTQGAGKGLLAALAARAAVVVTDEFPCFFLPAMVQAAGRALDVKLEQVDGNGLLPLRATEAPYPTAHAFRRFLQKNLASWLEDPPAADPTAGLPRSSRSALVPAEILARWPVASRALLAGDPTALAALPIDHRVAPVPIRGGSRAAEAALRRFLANGLPRYDTDRSEPELDVASGLSPYLHWGNIGPHQILAAIAEKEDWTPARLAQKATGSRAGWWGMSPAAESFLDELVTWRELGYVFCHHRPDHAEYSSLPSWALENLDQRKADPRPVRYSHSQLEAGATHDRLWNAAQRQLVTEGRLQNYLRMLWGKKVLEWSDTPEQAWATLVDLNNRYALDGRNPNSYSGIGWVFGRFDRPWGPRRPIFGTVRYMSSDNTARKFNVDGYIARYLD